MEQEKLSKLFNAVVDGLIEDLTDPEKRQYVYASAISFLKLNDVSALPGKNVKVNKLTETVLPFRKVGEN